MSGFKNTLLTNTPTTGGVVGVTLSTVAQQANAGAELPCRECFITANAGAISCHVAINTSVNVSLGCIVPCASVAGGLQPIPLRLPIDDVAKLWFFGTSGSIVNITFRE